MEHYILQPLKHNNVHFLTLQYNLNDQNKVMLVNKFYFQLIFQYLYVKNRYVDLLFEQFHLLILKLILKHHELLGVVDQNLK